MHDATSKADAGPNPDAAADAATGDAGDAGKVDGACSAATPEEACGNPACRPKLLGDFFLSLSGSCGYRIPEGVPECPAGSYCPAGTQCTKFDTSLCVPDGGAELCDSFRFVYLLAAARVVRAAWNMRPNPTHKGSPRLDQRRLATAIAEEKGFESGGKHFRAATPLTI